MHITFVIGGMGSGGAERVVANLANRLDDLGHRVTIIIFKDGNSYYKLNTGVLLKSYSYSSKNKITSIIKAIHYAKKAFNEVKPDIIISFLSTINIISVIANIFTRRPIIISERNDPNADPRQWYYRLLRKIFYRFADGYVFQTKQAQAFFNMSIQKRSVIIQKLVFINQNEYGNLPGIRNKNIVSVGRLEPQKNYKLLIDAFIAIKKDFGDYTLTIYGEGTQRNDLEKYISSKNLDSKVNLPGRVHDIYDKIKNSPLFVLSSDYEGMSNSLMEAMALGIPCISTDCPIGGSADLIKHRVNGILVPVGDCEKMSEAMKEVLSDHDFAQKLGMEAQKISICNSIETITNQWEKYIFKIYNRKNFN